LELLTVKFKLNWLTRELKMVYVRKEQASENRSLLLETAGRLFRERGIDGVGVAEIAREAGLTHGALYAHFQSKDALAAEAFSQGLERSREAMRAAMKRRRSGENAGVAPYLKYLLAAERRDNPGRSCPMTASASEIGRQGKEISERFVEGFLGKSAIFEAAIGDAMPAPRRRQLALAIVAAEIGAMAVARAVLKDDPRLSAEVLEAVRAVMTNLAEHSN
jgi:TetR/AcrR family transcriptional regulator, transcriptional repressor for nem operon